MAEKDFVVKNGLVVNGSITINSTAFYSSGTQFANSSFFSGQANTVNASYIASISANNASYLGGVAAASYVNTSADYLISGNINFTAVNNYFTNSLRVGANVILNATAVFVGNASVNAYLTSSGLYLNGAPLDLGGGYYKGNDGTKGTVASKNNLYRINSNTQTNNITIDAGENALTVGPMVIDTGYNLTISTGGRAVII